MSFTKTADELRAYVSLTKQAQLLRARNIIPAAGLAGLIYALGPRDSDRRMGLMTGIRDASKDLLTYGRHAGDALNVAWDNIGSKDIPILDKLRLLKSQLTAQTDVVLRPVRTGLSDFRAQLRDLGVPTWPGNTMDKGVGKLTSLFD